MKNQTILIPWLSYVFFTTCLLIFQPAYSCSTFKLQKGDHLVYGHNLNEGDIGVPGLVFINKRGVFKTGRTWSELTTKDKLNPSSHSWISRYGSITFNNFGRDFPDGGMNEVGLYIWEMNEDADYPKDENFPKLNQMNWMQYILDNFSSVDEALAMASDIEIDGWGWHYFLGDSNGNTAAVSFVDGKLLAHQGSEMPVPALFNTPYDREIELLKYYKGFGGLYDIDIDDPEVPRFAKAAKMIRDFDPADNAVQYGIKMLDDLKVNDLPEWSILFDVRNRDVYYKTRINPEVKTISMDDIDFSNSSPCLILDMDTKEGGDALSQFHPYTNEKMKDFTLNKIMTLLPAEFFTAGGISTDEYSKGEFLLTKKT